MREEVREDVAMWAGSEEDVEWQRCEKKRLRDAYGREWGTPPAEFG